MPLTDAQYAAWLQSPSARRVLLAEMHHASGVEYVASQPYVSGPNDNDPNRIYNDLLRGAVDITTRLDGRPELGELNLVDDGGISHWVGYQWRGHPLVLRLGSPDWPLDDFRVLARQSMAGVLGAQRGEVRLGVYDASSQLDRPVARATLPDGQPVPLVLGQVLGAEAVRVDTETLTYRVSQLPVDNLVVRDGNGPVLNHTADYANGQFVASAYTPRTIRCEVTEAHSTPTQIIQWVADQYGLSLDPAMTLPTYTLGLRYGSEVSGRQILDDVCNAISAHWSINLLGELTVQRLTQPTEADQVLDADDIEFGGIALTDTQEPLASLTLRYAQNHSPLDEVAGSINDADPDLADRLRTAWLAETSSNAVGQYPLAPDQTLDTALTDGADVTTELQHRLSIRSVRRDVWELRAFLPADTSLTGKAVSVNHPRLVGRLGRIISTRLSPIREQLTLEVWY